MSALAEDAPQRSSLMTTLCLIFVKEPVPGQVKTRLSPPLAPADACRLYGCFIEDILEAMLQLNGMDLALACDPAEARDFFRRQAPPRVRLFPQDGRDLGERQARALAWGLAQGGGAVLLRGSDTPDLPGAILLEAREKLASGEAEVVLGPARDGGYYLIGLKSLHHELFEDLPWSTGTVLADTLSRAAALSLKVHLLPLWQDIDTWADLLDFLKRPHSAPQPGWRSDRMARELLRSSEIV